jgi:nicotinamidase-related amidase
MKEALLVIDIQNDYFENGAMELQNANDALNNIKKVIEEFRKQKKDIVYIQHISLDPKIGVFLPNTHGAEIHDSIKPLSDEKIVVKHFPNSFRGTDLQKHLQEKHIEKLIITGMMTQNCVDSTTRCAKDLGYECVVLSDTCATTNLPLNGEIISAENINKSFLVAFTLYYAEVKSTKEYLQSA